MVYIPLDYWLRCDRCGGNYRKSEMREEWTGLWVCTKCFEPRHPQDSVTGVMDDVTVPVARPAVSQTMGETTLAADINQWTFTIELTSESGLAMYDPIGIVMDNEAMHWTFINSTPAGTTLEMGSSIPFKATSGNVVYLPSINNELYVRT